MNQELREFLIKFAIMIILAPLMGYALLVYFENTEKAWKSNNRKKRWFVMCGFFILLAIIGGWLR